MWRIKIPVHQTWHLTVFCAGIVAGLGLCILPFAEFFSGIIWVFIGVLLLIFVVIKRWRLLLMVAFIAGSLVGLSRGTVDYQQRTLMNPLIGQQVLLRGKVLEDVGTDDSGKFTIRLGNIVIDGRELPGRVWLQTNQAKGVERSDTLDVTGKISNGFGNFSASMYRAEIQQVFRPEPGDIALHIRDNFATHIRAGIAEPAASLGIGFLTGQRRTLPSGLANVLQLAGLTHIVVASGYNLTILVRFTRRFFAKISRFQTMFFSSLLILSFIAVTGLSPSMVRAGIVSGLALTAWYFGRKFHPITLIVLVAALTGLINPSYVWGDLGWQLSFASFFGVMILAPLLQNYFFGDKKPGTIRQVVGESVSAFILTAPLILYSFGTISNVAIVTNAIILPFVPLAMLLTFITGIASYIVPFAAHVIGWPAQFLLNSMVKVAETITGVSWAQTEWQPSFFTTIMLYVVIVLIILALKKTTKLNLRDSNIIE